MADLEFKCPECGGTRLNEVMVNVTVDSEIDRITDDEGVVDGVVYGDSTNEGGEVSHICCRNCGVVLTEDGGVARQSILGATPPNCISSDELVEWLKNQK